MRIQTLAGCVAALLRDPAVFLASKDYIFVVSHMRSYSSLLCHILGSNREISGYAETHLTYSGWTDMLRLRYIVSRTNGYRLDGRFVLDKILHNYHISEKILNKPNVRFIYLMRDPETTLKSILNMGRNLLETEIYTNVDEVFTYYLQRLGWIKECAASASGKALFLDSERLFEETDLVLHSLTQWLGLETELTSSYSQFACTGEPGYGDPSDTIKEGELLRDVDEHSNIHIPAAVVEQVTRAYRDCREALVQLADSI